MRKGNYERGERRHSAVLTEGDVIEMRRRYAEGETLAELSAAYPACNKSNIHHILNGRRWRHLLPEAVA